MQLHAKNGWWYCVISYSVQKGRYKRKWINTEIADRPSYKKQAEKKGRQLEAEFLEEVRLRRKGEAAKKRYHGDDTFEEYVDFWLHEKKGAIRPNSLVSYAGNIAHAKKYFGKMKIKDITSFDLEAFINDQIETCEQYEEAGDTLHNFRNSIEKHWSHLRMLLNFAYQRHDIKESVTVSQNYLRKVANCAVREEINPYSEEEEALLYAFIAGTPLEICVMLASKAGLRREEVLGLRWKHVDLDNGELHIVNTVVRSGSEIIENANLTKSQSSKRDIPLMYGLKEYLVEYKKEQAKAMKAFGRKLTEEDFVFQNPDGTRFVPDWITRNFLEAVRSCGLRETTFHGQRHYFATETYQKTNDVLFVSRCLGHKSIQVTLDIYTHFRLEDMKEKANKYNL